MEGWLKLYRKIRDWEWYKDINTKTVWLDLLVTANIRDCTYKGQVVPRGSLLTTYDDIAYATGLTKDEIRTAFKHLRASHTITTRKLLNKMLVTLCNFEDYQESESMKSHTITTRLSPDFPDGSHTVPTPIEGEGKEGEEDKKKNIHVVVSAREKDLGDLAAHYSKVISSNFSPAIVSDLEGYMDHMDLAVITDAMDRAADENKRSWSYVNGILRNRKQNGIKTMADVARADEERRQRVEAEKAKRSMGRNFTPQSVPAPDHSEIERRKKLLAQMAAQT